MAKLIVNLEAPMSQSFRAVRAANSVDLDIQKKALHHLEIDASIDDQFNVGVILGASGSGKTTLAKKIFGDNCFETQLRIDAAIIDQLPESLSFDECAAILQGVGLTSVPCWLKPVGVLSNGQKARAEAAIAMHSPKNPVVVDEWTSVVDRSVAKVMSHTVQKYARKAHKRLVLISCHYDVLEWLDPDWIIDCNQQLFIDRRLLSPSHRTRRERLEFELSEVPSATWQMFSKYHYLSDVLPAGRNYCFGLFHNGIQVSFGAFSNYIPVRKGSVPIYHSNRVVVHPDYAGFGLGLRMVNEAAKVLRARYGYQIRATFSSAPMFHARSKDKANWRLMKVERRIGEYKNVGDGIGMRATGFRQNVKLFTFEYIGP